MSLSDNSSIRNRAIAGSISGCATRFICQPLDVLKIRFQVQIEPLKKTNAKAVYRGIAQAVLHIIKNEGPSALWKGHIAAQALSITYGMFQFSVFGSLAHKLVSLVPTTSSFHSLVNFSAGFGAGCVATIASYPFDTIRTRLVVQGEPKVYRGIIDAAAKMTIHEGYFTLYRGMWPTLLQMGPYAGCQFAIYNFLINIYDQFITNDLNVHGRHENHHNVALRSLLSGAVSGAAAKTLVYPLDLCKKRLQIKEFDCRHQYRGLWDCILTTTRNETASALWKGLSPSLIKALLASALHFYFYETSLLLLNNRS